jgi:hypothetical protein
MLRYRKRSDAFLERVLAVLAYLAPARHLGVFCETLRDPLLPIRRCGLVGLMEARRPESEPVLLEFLRTNENIGSSVDALSALLRSGSETAITEAASRVIDLATVRGDDFDDEYGSIGLGELGVSPALPGLGFDLYVRVGRALLAKKSFSISPPGPDPTLSVFRPRADPRASRRAKAVLTGKRKEELLDLAQAEDLPRLDALLVELALEAIERASLDQPGFLPLGRRLSSFLRGSADCGLFEMLSLENRMDLVLLHGMVLAKAIRGRDVEVEFEEGEAEPGRTA